MTAENDSAQSQSPDTRLDITCYISYGQSDGGYYSKQLTIGLESVGIRVLVPEEQISAGSQWVNSLQDMINRADVFIWVGTPGALASDFIESEVTYFRDQGRPVIPIIFKNVTNVNTMPRSLLDITLLAEEGSAIQDGPSSDIFDLLVQEIKQKYQEGYQGRLKAGTERSSQKRPLNEGKLILVGRGEVGKTSLVRRLAENDFDADESKTHGIRITNWLLPRGGDKIRLNIWDFGGQEIMHATHQFFMTERSLYLLVLNGREGGEDVDAEYWLKHIQSFGGESPVIVVQNKITQHPFDLNYRDLRSRYPQIRGFVKTDCKDQTGLTELHTLIEDVVDDMPEMKIQFPEDWFRVKEQLEAMQAEHLSFREFVNLCVQEGITDEKDRDALAYALHCLGIALNYRGDLRLRDTSILKPEWVTQGIYAILNSKKLAAQQGELALKELQEILPTTRYPSHTHLFLLELMRKFSLCFPFRDPADRYLIPELLGKEEPEAVATFQPEHCLNFEYHYGVIPEGLLPRFIVRTYPLSYGQPRWRSGVILTHEGCSALVKANMIERRVMIRVRDGDADLRRNLLAIIRYDFDVIHAEFKDRLDVQAKVPLAEFPTLLLDYNKLVALEQIGAQESPEFTGQELINVHVSELLNDIDFEAQRGDAVETLSRAKPLFFSYSHKDEGLRDELESNLKLLQRQGVISTRHDRKIESGDEWKTQIDSRLEQATIILLLISADFIDSDYCWKIEMKRALERHKAKEAVVIPVMLRHCDWKGAPFAELQGLPTGMEPVTSWSDRDAAWTDVATGIRKIAEELPPSPFGTL
ncbi:MAG: TIR domain-containing protein [Anaerolineae bacterium]|nr:TIR domain-containing protein [Anaerolineae bacterium]